MSTQRNTLLILLVIALLALPALACDSGGSVSASGGASSLPASGGSSGHHTVQPADTLSKIAQRYGTTVEALVAANQSTYPSLATDPGLIQVGWVLVIPGASHPSQPPPTLEYVTIPLENGRITINAALLNIDTAAVEQEIFRLVNEERVKAGVHPLVWDPVLAEIARVRSQDMVERGYFSHYDPVTGEALVDKLLGERGYPPGGENIDQAGFYDQASAASNPVRSWMASPGHRENILRAEYHTTGVGMALIPGSWGEAIFTQIFLR